MEAIVVVLEPEGKPKKILKHRPGDRAKYNARQREYMRKRREAAKLAKGGV